MLSDIVKSIVKVDALIVLSLLMIEKLVEFEFFCPCDPGYTFVVEVLFISSTILVAFLTMVIQISNYRKLERHCCYRSCCCMMATYLSAQVAVLTWLSVLFSDGQFVVCLSSDWTGVWTTSSEFPMKWCKPFNETHSAWMEKESFLIFASSKV